MILFPNCKINIGLDVVARRDDGYHEIITAMYPIPWNDVLEIVPAKGASTTLRSYGRAIACTAENNLVIKAYRALDRRIKIPPVDIYLEKIIPDGAGLGGGSSDAAFTLTGLNHIFSLGLSKEDLAEIASEIGADCPFFIYDTPMLATGIGTELKPSGAVIDGMTVLIAKPAGVNVSTALAYRGITPAKPEHQLAESLSMPIKEWQYRIKNDFEKSIFPIFPEIARVKHTMQSHGAIYSSMSGSGAGVFGIFEDDNLAETARISLHGCDTFICRL